MGNSNVKNKPVNISNYTIKHKQILDELNDEINNIKKNIIIYDKLYIQLKNELPTIEPNKSKLKKHETKIILSIKYKEKLNLKLKKLLDKFHKVYDEYEDIQLKKII